MYDHFHPTSLSNLDYPAKPAWTAQLYHCTISNCTIADPLTLPLWTVQLYHLGSSNCAIPDHPTISSWTIQLYHPGSSSSSIADPATVPSWAIQLYPPGLSNCVLLDLSTILLLFKACMSLYQILLTLFYTEQLSWFNLQLCSVYRERWQQFLCKWNHRKKVYF